MAINPLAGTASLLQSQTTTSRAGIADNFDAFLQLLTTQLKNQNPLEPLDTNEFTAQLVQFSGVEQSLRTNENLQQLINLSAVNSVNAVVGYIGKEVTASGSTTYMSDGQAKWEYKLSADAPDTTITIRDAYGSIVKTETLSLSAGKGTYEWDGQTDDGQEAPDGEYSITIDAKDDAGSYVAADTIIRGIVESIDLSTSEPMLTVSGITIRLSQVMGVGQPSES